MKNKKGQQYIAEFAFAVIILTLVFLFFKMATLGFFDFLLPSDLYVAGSAEEIKLSAVCGANLVNFLRFDSGGGVSYADLIAANPEEEDTAIKIKDFFDDKYRRGNERRQEYNFFVKQGGVNLIQIVNLEDAALEPNTCSATIPSSRGRSLTAKLELEY
jgi:hypothetical protein